MAPVILITEQPSTIKSNVILLHVTVLALSWKRVEKDKGKKLAESNHREKS